MKAFSFGLVVTVAVAWAHIAPAQDLVGANDVSLDKADLIREMEPQPPTFSINSAIVLTNPHGRPGEFKIELYDNEGNVAGGGSATVAPRSLEVIWVSTLLNDQTTRFVGWGIAKSTRPLECNAYLAGIGVTELPVKNQRTRISATDVASRRKLFSLLAALP